MADVVLYEVFEEEADALRRCWPKEIKAKFTDKTIQERRPSFPHSPFICVRTQSIIPESWASKLKGILTRSAGYDHLLAYLQKTGKKIPCGYLPQYCARAVAEHAVMVAFELLRKTKKQLRQL